jgi:dimethylhistidine N-methyltransferase
LSSRLPVAEAATSDDPARARFLQEALAGLTATPKSLPSKYFYDRRGSELFDRITELPEYYPTRTEMAILQDNLEAIAGEIGAGTALIEYGSGSSQKTRLLLDRLAPALAAYVPIDISAAYLADVADDLRAAYPGLPVFPVAADYSARIPLPPLPDDTERRVVFFPGSTIGNFTPDEAEAFLRRAATLVGPGGGLVIGTDLKKDRETLEAAYDDAAGVTAAFNLNLLRRLRDELGADLDLGGFRHRAVWNEDDGRVEMHLVSARAQAVRLGGQEIAFDAGETIHTENSYKYTPDAFDQLAARAGFILSAAWTDAGDRFRVASYTHEA